MSDEIVRVTCPNPDCEYHGQVNEYNENYRQHSIHLCGNCGGELHELIDNEQPRRGAPFRRVKSSRPLYPANHPQINGLTQRERAAGWEIRSMTGKHPPEVADG